MKKLKDEYRAICKEYARQTGKIIGYEPQFFLRDRMAVNTCLFGDNYFLNMDQMQQIVDHMDKWLRHYGTVEKVGEEVIAWMDYTRENGDTINLWQWLSNLDWPGSPFEELKRLEKQLNVLEEVAKHYPTSSIGNIIMQMSARVKVINERIKEKRL